MTVGKKKKKVIVYRSGKKTSLVPFIIAGGVVLWAMFGNKPAAAAVPVTTLPDPSLDPGYYDTGITPPPSGQVYVPSAPVTSIITTTDPVKKSYLDSIKTRIPASAPIWPALNNMSQQALANIWSITQYINYADQPGYYAAFVKMTDKEISDSWYYVGTYLGTGNPLNSGGNGGNPTLYAAIQNIHLKYGIF